MNIGAENETSIVVPLLILVAVARIQISHGYYNSGRLCCCCCWPPVRELCPNYEVVEFHPRTLTTPDLGSIAYCYTIIYPFRPTFFFSIFLDHSVPPLPTPSPSISIHPRIPFDFHPLPTSSPSAKPPTWASPEPTTHQPLPLFPAPRAVCLCLFPFPVAVRSPLCIPQPAPRSLPAPGGFAPRGSLRASVSLPRPL